MSSNGCLVCGVETQHLVGSTYAEFCGPTCEARAKTSECPVCKHVDDGHGTGEGLCSYLTSIPTSEDFNPGDHCLCDGEPDD